MSYSSRAYQTELNYVSYQELMNGTLPTDDDYLVWLKEKEYDDFLLQVEEFEKR